MWSRRFNSLALALLAAAGTTFPVAAVADSGTTELIRLRTSRGAFQPFLLLRPQKPPIAAAILFAGGKGTLGLHSSRHIKRSRNNFLVRTRDKFAADGLLVAVMDVPSDRLAGISIRFRMSAAHARDIADVAHYLRSMQSNRPLPVWLIGTSRGTISAANAAIRRKGFDGVVLTSPVTRANPKWDIASKFPDGIISMQLPSIRVPTLVAAHRRDTCHVTPPDRTSRLRDRLSGARPVNAILIDGGTPARAKPCKALTPHGFYGVESETVKAITQFISKHRN